MSRKSLDLFDGVGSWKRRPIRASRKTYMPSSKRWGKIEVTKMPIPQGEITTSEILNPEPPLPEDPTETELKEEESESEE